MIEHPGTSVDRLQRAMGFKIEGQYDQALDELFKLIDTTPDDPEAHHQVGLIFGFTGSFEKSLEELRQASTLAPENILIRNDLALTYTMLGMYDEAKAQFALVLERDRENQIALRNLNYFE